MHNVSVLGPGYRDRRGISPLATYPWRELPFTHGIFLDLEWTGLALAYSDGVVDDHCHCQQTRQESKEDQVKLYLAASFRAQHRMLEFAEYLAGRGYEVTSRWIYQKEGEALELHSIKDHPDELVPFAIRDMQDIDAADVVVVFSWVDSTTGGFHTEFGYALGKVKPLVVVGPRLNVFHCLPQVKQVDSIVDLVKALEAMAQ